MLIVAGLDAVARLRLVGDCYCLGYRSSSCSSCLLFPSSLPLPKPKPLPFFAAVAGNHTGFQCFRASLSHQFARSATDTRTSNFLVDLQEEAGAGERNESEDGEGHPGKEELL